MLKVTMGNEVKLIIVAIVCALLLIIGHVLLAKAFADMAWAEHTTAAIPFVMMAICGFAIKYAKDQDVD
ncbi:asparaginyl-tRNA synthetase [Vibrio lentus]|nr:asparaginyl-tRNA synthetase [Vibrio lentus]